MKLFFLVFATSLIAGCNQPSKPDPRVSQLLQSMATLSNEVVVLKAQAKLTGGPANTNLVAQIAAVKLWTLDRLEEVQLEEAAYRHNLATNLEAQILISAHISANQK